MDFDKKVMQMVQEVGDTIRMTLVHLPTGLKMTGECFKSRPTLREKLMRRLRKEVERHVK